MHVKNGKRPAALSSGVALPQVLVASSFRVVISADDMTPIEVSFPGDATEGTISGIPAGRDRRVLIEAINSDNQVVRKREISGISIQGGTATQIQAALLSIPWVTNIKEGSVVPLNRLVFKGYGEPAAGVEVTDQFAGVSASLSDIATEKELVVISKTDGSFTFRPKTLSPGKHLFEFRDPQTEESSRLRVTLIKTNQDPETFVGYGGGISPLTLLDTGDAEILNTSTEEVP